MEEPRDTPEADTTNNRRKLAVVAGFAVAATMLANPIVQAERGMDPCAVVVENPFSWISGPGCLASRAIFGHPAA